MADDLTRLAAVLLGELNPYERFGLIYQTMEELLDRFLDDPQLCDEPEVEGLQEALEAFDGVRHWLSENRGVAEPAQRWSPRRWEGTTGYFLDGEETPAAALRGD